MKRKTNISVQDNRGIRVTPNLIVGEKFNGYVSGDILDANSVAGVVKDNVDKILDGVDVDFDTLKEIADGLALKVDEDDLKDIFCINVTYNELVSLRNTNKLFPGCHYRITDYVTTTVLDNTLSAGHAFDIIVLATDVNKLNENARAILHSGDTYFAGSKLGAWELKYCLDNDTNRFVWADSTNGKGVIYYMKDEFGNECPYDFKNIMFERWKIDTVSAVTGKTPISDLLDAYIDVYEGSYASYTSSTYNVANNTIQMEVDSSDSMFFYTFSAYSDGDVLDDSLIPYCHGNKFGIYMLNEIQTLNNNVLCDADGQDSDNFYGNVFGEQCRYNTVWGYSFYSNSFGNSCNSNFFGDNYLNNSFGDACYSNTFGDDCEGNSFGNSCHNNSFGNNCSSNSFEEGGYYNSFGNECQNNTFGDECGYNSFGINCCYNTFDSNCGSNSFGSDNSYNSFENDCNNNSLEGGCTSNSFGNSCNNNTFGDECSFNAFGDRCNSINFQKNYTLYCIVENGNHDINLTSTATTSYSNNLQNITIAQGVNNTSTAKTISHNTVNDAFKTTYQPANSQIISV